MIFDFSDLKFVPQLLHKPNPSKTKRNPSDGKGFDPFVVDRFYLDLTQQIL